MNQNDLERLVSDCHAGLQYLLGNPRFPDASGAIVRMEDRLEKQNGHIASLLEDIEQAKLERELIKENQKRILSRLFSALPSWGQKTVIVIAAIGILSMVAIGMYIKEKVSSIL